jgi:hypothetical protein
MAGCCECGDEPAGSGATELAPSECHEKLRLDKINYWRNVLLFYVQTTIIQAVTHEKVLEHIKCLIESHQK